MRARNWIKVVLILLLTCGAGEAKRRKKGRVSSETIKKKFSYSINDLLDCLVIIKHELVTGSGFIAKMDGKYYIFTNQHVVLGGKKISFKTISGKTLHPKWVELSETRDVARFLIDSEVGLAISKQAEKGEFIAVFGNSSGAGVATELFGTILKITPDLLQVSADFVSGNSGSPVLNLNKEVVGIASYVRSASKKGHTRLRNKKMSRFCYRLTDLRWKAINWKKYNKKYCTVLDKTKKSVEDFFVIITEWSESPFSKIPPKKLKDLDLQKWAKNHNGMVNKIKKMSKKGQATEAQLKRINSQIRTDLIEGARDLSAVCARRIRQIKMFEKQKELTGFLRLEFVRLETRLHRAKDFFDSFEKKLAHFNFFHFN